MDNIMDKKTEGFLQTQPTHSGSATAIYDICEKNRNILGSVFYDYTHATRAIKPICISLKSAFINMT